MFGLGDASRQRHADPDAGPLWRVAERGVGDDRAVEAHCQRELDVFNRAVEGVVVDRGDSAQHDVTVSAALILIRPDAADKGRAASAGVLVGEHLIPGEAAGESVPVDLAGLGLCEIPAVSELDHHVFPPPLRLIQINRNAIGNTIINTILQSRLDLINVKPAMT